MTSCSRSGPIALFGLALSCHACAPVADFRPPSALVRGDRDVEVGGGGVYVSPRPYVIESGHGSGQVWLTGRVAPWLSLSTVTAVDGSSLLGGVGALGRFLTTDRVVAGTGVEVGYAWGAASLSGAVRLFDDTWLYTAPRLFNWGKFAAFGLPFGASVHVTGGFHLRAEAQLSWEDFQYYNRRLHLGAAAVYAW